MTQQQFLDHQTGLDGLTQADVVGKQKVGARRRKRTAQRLHLVSLKLGTHAKRRLERPVVGARDSTPTHGVHKSAQRIGIVKRLGTHHLGQASFGKDGLSNLKFPDNRELLAHAVFGKRLQRYEVLFDRPSLVGRAARDSLLTHLSHCPCRSAHLNDLPRFRHGRNGNLMFRTHMEYLSDSIIP